MQPSHVHCTHMNRNSDALGRELREAPLTRLWGHFLAATHRERGRLSPPFTTRVPLPGLPAPLPFQPGGWAHEDPLLRQSTPPVRYSANTVATPVATPLHLHLGHILVVVDGSSTRLDVCRRILLFFLHPEPASRALHPELASLGASLGASILGQSGMRAGS